MFLDADDNLFSNQVGISILLSADQIRNPNVVNHVGAREGPAMVETLKDPEKAGV